MNIKINLKELKKDKERNFKERLEFIDKYADWIKAVPDKKWSKAQKEFLDSQYK